MDLASHQRSLLELIETGALPREAADDQYLQEVATSRGLRVVREIVSRWETFDVRRSCPLTSAALDHEGRLEELVRTASFGSGTAFVESRRRLFLEHVAECENGVVRSLARFELALAATARGDTAPHVIEWDRDPAPVINGLAEGRWLADAAERGQYRTVVARDLPGLVRIEAAAGTPPVDSAAPAPYGRASARDMEEAPMAGPVKVLSIDGGGIRGIVPAQVLARLEHDAGKPVSELFDLITGTSTGGIIALGLTVPGPDGKPAHAAQDLVDLYVKEGRTIFSRSLWHEVVAADSTLGPKYPVDGLERVLKTYLGEARLKDALAEVLVTAYEIEDRIPWFFSSRDAKARPDYDFPTWEVARATSAAPTYFEPARITAKNDRGYWSFVDGGVFANNPAMCGLVEASSHYRADHDDEAPDVLLVSLGTGELTRTIPYQQAQGWGLVGWARPLLGVVFDGVSKTVEFQARELCRVGKGMPERFYRFQVNLAQYGNDDLDDASGTNLLALQKLADDMLAARSADVAAMCRQLTDA